MFTYNVNSTLQLYEAAPLSWSCYYVSTVVSSSVTSWLTMLHTHLT